TLRKMDGPTLRRLFGYIRREYWVRFIAVILLVTISAITNVLSALYIGDVIDHYITPLLSQSTPNFGPLLTATAVIGGIYFLGVFATLYSGRFMVKITQGIMQTIRDELFTHMEHLPMAYFDRHPRGDVMSHYTTDTDALREMLSQSVIDGITMIVTIVFVFLSMIFISVPLTLLVLLTLFLIFWLNRRIEGVGSRYFIKQQDSLADIDSAIEEMLHGEMIIKVFCQEEAVERAFAKKNDALFRQSTLANTTGNFVEPLIDNGVNIQYALVALVGGCLILTGISPLSLGALVAFISLTHKFLSPVDALGEQMNAMVTALAGAKRIFNLMDVPLQGTGGAPLKQPVQGHLAFKDVSFSYIPGQSVLSHIHLTIEGGQKVAIVGTSGSGKSTLIKLLNRFYPVVQGNISCDGQNLAALQLAPLRRSMGTVLQDTHLFSGTVRDNIRYGNPTATQTEVENAAKLACSHDFITRLPQGYDTPLDSMGLPLSLGQRQLLTIARALATHPPLLVLDDATASADTLTEARIWDNLRQNMAKQTLIIIAKRLDTIMDSDMIYVMDGGKIVEMGNHGELMAKKGLYYTLVMKNGNTDENPS
ncbi:ABC transporter ATP-binding protein, partial [Eubacterium aggregans]|uniref:ABC transporter ATP-binding protein n=1 Tax=Eubacterium aggregans TaxID=81409 RepID=UPI0023F54213